MTYRLFSVQTKTALETRKIIYQYQNDNRWLSNFWPCRIFLPRERNLPMMIFDNVEKAYMAWKTTDQSVREKIKDMTPGDAKKFSHSPEFVYREPYTDQMRIEIMENLIEQKFGTANPLLMQMLTETKDALLIEGNLHSDTFFGMDLNSGYGLNHLGRIQMKIRQKRLDQFA